MPLRVLHLYAGNLYGGIERMLVTLARHRAECPEMEPQFALCFEDRLSEELSRAGATVHQLEPARFRLPWKTARTRRQLRQILEKHTFDVAISHGSWPHAMLGPVCQHMGIPVVFWAHDATSGKHRVDRFAKRTRPDAVIANSHYTMQSIHGLFDVAQRKVIYCAVEAPAASDAERVRASLGTPSDRVVIVLASRIEQWKGHELLLAALSQLPPRLKWECWIVGGPQRPTEQDYFQHLRSLAAESPYPHHIRFLGQRDDVPALLTAADIHCQPNTAPEPFGIAFVEALFAGIPVVTTRLGGAVEIVNDTCGVLVPPGDPTALATALEELISNDANRESLGSNGPARAAGLCDVRARMRDLVGLLGEVVGVPAEASR
jgi:glycosyltransferase involved in cell wall biosynthesis